MLMSLVQEERLGGNSLTFADKCRKGLAKKIGPVFQECEDTFYKNIEEKQCSKLLARYVWDIMLRVQRGYSFNRSHCLAYSLVALQEMNLCFKYPTIFWNTACLIINSGGEDGSTDYTKLAKAIGETRTAGIELTLVDINSSEFGFKPDVEHNQILFGMKGLLNVGDDIIGEIIKNRPYESFEDFCERVPLNKQAMISLIKSGAFEAFDDRRKIMVSYLWRTCDKKKNLTLSNIPMLLKNNLVPEEYAMEKRIFEFNRYLKSECKFNLTDYKLDDRSRDFLEEIDAGYLTNDEMLSIKSWDKAYKKYMDTLRDWLNENKQSLLQTVNELAFKEEWDKYAGDGNTSAWEMETMCFYHGKHELADIDMYKYGLSSFSYLPEEPVIEKTFKRGDVMIPIYKLNRICGTCIAKDKLKGTVYLLTTDGVVPVKFRKEYFSIFDKRISGYGEDGKKHILETSWFERGKKIVVQGIRRGDMFIPKKYASSKTHQLLLIDKIEKNGDIVLRSERILGDSEDEI